MNATLLSIKTASAKSRNKTRNVKKSRNKVSGARSKIFRGMARKIFNLIHRCSRSWCHSIKGIMYKSLCSSDVTDQNFELQYPEGLRFARAQNSLQPLYLFGSRRRAGWCFYFWEKFGNWATFANSASLKKVRNCCVEIRVRVFCINMFSRNSLARRRRKMCLPRVCAFTYAHTETWKLSARAQDSMRWAARTAERLIIHIEPKRCIRMCVLLGTNTWSTKRFVRQTGGERPTSHKRKSWMMSPHAATRMVLEVIAARNAQEKAKLKNLMNQQQNY